jgi:hypothetical protein
VTGSGLTSDWLDFRFAVFDHPEPLLRSSDSLLPADHEGVDTFEIDEMGDTEINYGTEIGIKNVLSNLSFLGRYELLTNVPTQHPFVVLTSQVACSGLANILIFIIVVISC